MMGISSSRALTTSGLCGLIALEYTTTSAPPTLSAAWPKKTRTPSASRRRVFSFGLRSEPLTSNSRVRRTSARPLMPIPPIPTKWTWRTRPRNISFGPRCRCGAGGVRAAHARRWRRARGGPSRRDARRRVDRAREPARPWRDGPRRRRGGGRSRWPGAPRRPAPAERKPRRPRAPAPPRSAPGDRRLRAERARAASAADGRDLGDRARAGPGDHQIGVGDCLGHVVDEGDHTGSLDLRARVGVANGPVAVAPRLVKHVDRPTLEREAPEGLREALVEDGRALAASHDEDPNGRAAPRRRARREARPERDSVLPDRARAEARDRLFPREKGAPREGREETVREPDGAVGLEHGHRTPSRAAASVAGPDA